MQGILKTRDAQHNQQNRRTSIKCYVIHAALYPGNTYVIYVAIHVLKYPAGERISYMQTYALKNIRGETPILNHGHAQPNAYQKPWGAQERKIGNAQLQNIKEESLRITQK